MSEQYMAIARRFPCEVINEQNLDLIDELFAPDFIEHAHAFAPEIGKKSGREGVRQSVEMVLSAFPDLHVKIEDEVDEGDMVVQRNTVSGTHKGDFMGVPPTEKRIVWREIQYIRVRGGKLAERWANVDETRVLQEIGGIPSHESEENKNTARRLFLEAINQGNLDVVDEVVAANYVYHGASEKLTGSESLKQLIRTYRAAFPDLQMAIDHQVASADKVVTRFTARGTHEGQLDGLEPTGKQVTITGMSIIRFADGKGVEEWEIYDTLGMMRQLGGVRSDIFVKPSLKPRS